MLKVGHDTLRRKVDEATGARSPLRDAGIVGEMFARLLEERLRSTLKMPVAVLYKSYAKQTFAKALEEVAQPSVLAFARLRGGAFGGFLPLDAPFIFNLIEVITGVETASTDIPNRTLTPIDEALSEDFAGHLINCFESAVAPRGAGDNRGSLRFDRFRRSAGMDVGIAEDADMLGLSISVALGAEAQPRDLVFHVPFSVLDFYRAAEDARAAVPKPPPKHAASKANPESVWSQAMVKAAKTAELRLVAVLTQMKLSIEDITAMKPGAVLPLQDGVDMSVDLRLDKIGGVAQEPQICVGALGVASGKRAVKVEEPPDPDFVDRVTPYMSDG